MYINEMKSSAVGMQIGQNDLPPSCCRVDQQFYDDKSVNIRRLYTIKLTALIGGGAGGSGGTGPQ